MLPLDCFILLWNAMLDAQPQVWHLEQLCSWLWGTFYHNIFYDKSYFIIIWYWILLYFAILTQTPWDLNALYYSIVDMGSVCADLLGSQILTWQTCASQRHQAVQCVPNKERRRETGRLWHIKRAEPVSCANLIRPLNFPGFLHLNFFVQVIEAANH